MAGAFVGVGRPLGGLRSAERRALAVRRPPAGAQARRARRPVQCTAQAGSDPFPAALERALSSRFKPKEVRRVLQSFRATLRGEALIQNDGTPQLQHAHSFINGLTAIPWHSTSNATMARYHLWMKQLVQRTDDIAEELRDVGGLFHPKPDAPQELQRRGNNVWAAPAREEASAYGPEWRTLVLQDRDWDETNTALFPKTTAAVRECGVDSVEVFFAKQAVESGIAPHTDGCNFILTAHLPLWVPTEQDGGRAWIEVAGEKQDWVKGKGMVFDTSFLHQTWNPSPSTERYVLLIRFWHPQLTAAERQALAFVFKAIEQPELVLD